MIYKHAQWVSKSRIWGARKKALSGLEGLLAIVGLKVTTEDVKGVVYKLIRRAGGREFQIWGAATLTPRAPDEVRTNGTDRRFVPVQSAMPTTIAVCIGRHVDHRSHSGHSCVCCRENGMPRSRRQDEMDRHFGDARTQTFGRYPVLLETVSSK